MGRRGQAALSVFRAEEMSDKVITFITHDLRLKGKMNIWDGIISGLMKM